MFGFEKKKGREAEPAPQEDAEARAIIYSSDNSKGFHLPRGEYEFLKGITVSVPSTHIKGNGISNCLDIGHSQSVSSRNGPHASLHLGDESYVRDNDSRFGTYVDGEKLRPKEPYVVSTGEHILKLGDLEFRLDIL